MILVKVLTNREVSTVRSPQPSFCKPLQKVVVDEDSFLVPCSQFPGLRPGFLAARSHQKMPNKNKNKNG